jgi:hypothetical protein
MIVYPVVEIFGSLIIGHRLATFRWLPSSAVPVPVCSRPWTSSPAPSPPPTSPGTWASASRSPAITSASYATSLRAGQATHHVLTPLAIQLLAANVDDAWGQRQDLGDHDSQGLKIASIMTHGS